MQAQQLSEQIDALYNACFAGLTVKVAPPPRPPGSPAPSGAEQPAAEQQQPEEEETEVVFESMSEARFAALGREQPQLVAALLDAKQQQDAQGWTDFQAQVRAFSHASGAVLTLCTVQQRRELGAWAGLHSARCCLTHPDPGSGSAQGEQHQHGAIGGVGGVQVRPLKLQRTRVEREAEDLGTALQEAARRAAQREADEARQAYALQREQQQQQRVAAGGGAAASAGAHLLVTGRNGSLSVRRVDIGCGGGAPRKGARAVCEGPPWVRAQGPTPWRRRRRWRPCASSW